MTNSARLKTLDEHVKKLMKTSSLSVRHDQIQSSLNLQQKTLHKVWYNSDLYKRSSICNPIRHRLPHPFPLQHRNRLDVPHLLPPLHQHPSLTRPHHMDFSYFDGENAAGWLFHAAHYFQFYPTADDQRLLI